MNKTECIMIRISSTLKKILEENARKNNIGYSEYIRKLILSDSTEEQIKEITAELIS